MNIVLAFGGLGNQMSQYAFFYQKQKVSSCTVFNSYIIRRQSEHYGYELERVFDISDSSNFIIDGIVRYARKLLYLKDKYLLKYLIRPVIFISKCGGIHLIHENSKFDHSFLEKRLGLNVYCGGWLSEKYFKDVESNIRKIFSFDLNKLNKQSRNIINRIKTCNSVSLHIRRGDYMKPSNKLLGMFVLLIIIIVRSNIYAQLLILRVFLFFPMI